MKNNYKGLLFIGDPLMSNTKPGRRADDNFIDVVAKKLSHALSVAKDNELRPVILGGLTSKSFEVKVLSVLIDILKGHDAIILASSHDYTRGKEEINANSTVGIIQAAGIGFLASSTGYYQDMVFSTSDGEDTYSIYTVMESGLIPSSVLLDEEDTKKSILLSRCNISDTEDNKTKPFKVAGCELVVCGMTREAYAPSLKEDSMWFAPGPLARVEADQDSVTPTVWEWVPGKELVPHVVPHQASVMDMSGLASERVQGVYSNSEFATLLKNEALRAKDNDDNKDILGEEIMSIFSDKAPSLDCREIILELKEQTDNKEELELI